MTLTPGPTTPLRQRMIQDMKLERLAKPKRSANCPDDDCRTGKATISVLTGRS